ncbi:MAG: C25 family cysteine peptidase, partial [Candidatus Eisenbacteria bacterium]
VELRPFRYDETTQRVSAPLALTVRVDFNRPAGAAALSSGIGASDRHADAVLEASVLNWEQGRSWRVAPVPRASRPRESGFGAVPSAAGAFAFDDSDPEVRVQLGETALYRLSADELLANGYPAGVPVAEVSVHRHEFGASNTAGAPYATLELPSEVEDQDGDGTLNAGDGVWLWQRSWAARSGATNYQRFWGDGEVVYVTRKSGGGLRVPQRAAWNNAPSPVAVASFPSFTHHERDFAPMMQAVFPATDTSIGVWQWTDRALYYQRPDTIRFTVSDLDTTHAVTFSVRWVGRVFESHFMWAGVRNTLGQVTTLIDSVSWFGKNAVVRSATFPGSVLSSGLNSYRHWGKNALGQPNPATNFNTGVGLDWFELTYWRGYRAVGDYLRFNSATATGDYQMSLDGFLSDSVRVYDVTDPEQPVRIPLDPAHTVSGATLAFEIQDNSLTRREYVAASQLIPADPSTGPKSPPPSAYTRVTRRQLYNNTAGDYLLVYPEAFASAVPALAQLRRSQGLSVIEAPLEAVLDEFGGGRHSPYGLQRFTRYAYEHWNTRFLLMVGNGTLDPQGARSGSARDWIPVLPTPGPVGTGEGAEIVPSDNRYGYITGSEDPSFSLDTNRVVPEIMVGRLTGNNLSEIQSAITKIIAYENLSGPDDWRRNILLCADDAYSGDGFDTFTGGATSGYCHRSYEELFVGLNNTMQSFILSDTGVAGMNVEQFNLRSYLTNEPWTPDPVSGDSCRISRADAQAHTHAYATQQLLGKLNSGQLMWNYQGHANEYLLTHEDLWLGALIQDAGRLQNDNMPFLFTAFSCHANMFARPEVEARAFPGPCIGSGLTALPNRGAIASWASVCFEVVPRNDRDHVDVELIRSMFVNPPRDEFLGGDDRGSRVVLGEVILSTLFRYLGTTRSYQPERGLATSYTLIGDPATRLSIGRPFNHLTVDGTPVPDGVPMRLHTLSAQVNIQADLVSNVRLDSLAVLENQVPMPANAYTVSPAFPDTAVGSTFGGRHFRVSMTPTLAARDVEYTVLTRDRNGLTQSKTLSLRLETVLRSGGAAISDNDAVAPTAALSLLLLSPAPIADPASEVTLLVNGAPQSFTYVAVPSDTTDSGVHSKREWVLSWNHAPYAIDNYSLVLSVQGGASVTRRFIVTAASGQLGIRDLIPFPNPFDNTGTNFSFFLQGTEPADVKIHVFTQSGRSIYTNVVRDLNPGYHQIAWDGKDAEGDELANGVYFFRLSVSTSSGGSTQQLGRLVKLRRPRRIEEPTLP